ncbi:phosphoglycerate mutase-like protein [Trametes versicolor FP-101664 SS1]|uniref:phosphoglycerate mutase-like protein n=1 Tax=Trametes versicolor (strain FP-101664) TaxID=717944 RepID=UPI0004623E1D|nr:phosphoglycerate mutase-like protein [Trametes versicolor FP-101664 SS1]EIW59438.1 phosphoglycerate mutase-like protein [Trametes versicolor FP-101664 SS1]
MSAEAAPTLTVTFIRHGESTDNLRSVWAGWKDAPLSNHGMNQAKAVGKSLSDTRFAVVYASPLKRALWTGQAVQEAQSEPKPPLETSLLLREQHWGVAEGEPWQWGHTAGLSLEEHFAKQLYPVLHERWQKFPEGESLDDLFTRAKQAIDELIMPHVWSAAREGKKGIHIAIASHGLCISELVPALVMKDESGVHPGEKFRGLQNTAWTRVTVNVKGAKEGEPLDFPDNDPPKLQVRVTDFNRHEHLDAVKRQKGGVGSAGYDPKQQDIRAFFGGAKVPAKGEAAELEEGRSESNARDEVDVDIQ